ncbi:hypothetical protein UlMin_020743 [Ulmus minor]
MNRSLQQAKVQQREKCLEVLSQSHLRFSCLMEVSSYETFWLGWEQALMDPSERIFSDCTFTSVGDVLRNKKQSYRLADLLHDDDRTHSKEENKFTHQITPPSNGDPAFHFTATEENKKNKSILILLDYTYVNRLINIYTNKCSLEIDYKQFIYIHPNIVIWLADAPQPVLKVMKDVAKSVVFNLHPNYKKIPSKDLCPHDQLAILSILFFVFPILPPFELCRQIHLNTMICIGGVLQQVKYDCKKCGTILEPIFQNSYSEVKVGSCPECQSKGLFTINIEHLNYIDLTLLIISGIEPAGHLPRYKEVILLNDLIDCARLGEEIEVTRVYTNNFDLSLNTKNGFPIFATVVEANYVTKKQDLFSDYKLTQTNSILKSSPSIYGHDNIKTAISLAMFGGLEKNVEGKHRLRGDINVLLLGDPGIAKSQFLKYVEKTGQRAIYTTGKGAFDVGLTAMVHKDPVTREWTLEGGALVLADKGICLIDEFDKMNDQDRVSIHEAMEQQSISISKAGIVTSLQARCSVIVATNPIGGSPVANLFDLLGSLMSHLCSNEGESSCHTFAEGRSSCLTFSVVQLRWGVPLQFRRPERMGIHPLPVSSSFFGPIVLLEIPPAKLLFFLLGSFAYCRLRPYSLPRPYPSLCSSPHSRVDDCLMHQKNGLHLSDIFEINLLRAATFSARLWTSLTVFGSWIWDKSTYHHFLIRIVLIQRNFFKFFYRCFGRINFIFDFLQIGW